MRNHFAVQLILVIFVVVAGAACGSPETATVEHVDPFEVRRYDNAQSGTYYASDPPKKYWAFLFRGRRNLMYADAASTPTSIIDPDKALSFPISVNGLQFSFGVTADNRAFTRGAYTGRFVEVTKPVKECGVEIYPWRLEIAGPVTMTANMLEQACQ